jgi:hypothetical protein
MRKLMDEWCVLVTQKENSDTTGTYMIICTFDDEEGISITQPQPKELRTGSFNVQK